ncbi:hypothetical protein SUDANB105_00434 [Streptomyces sp. enrichment culture]|uniref:glycoside hydrolase family 78 protein n=1 Tax=Streptomyces sp. enrichment culture TaxID=1795815 RepID=UPI003F549C71
MTAGIAGAGSAAAAPGRDEATVTGLTVEHRTDPLGVDAPRPRYGWRMASATRGRRQSAYRILAATSRGRLRPGRADVWHSGRITGPDSVAVRHGGEPLRPSTATTGRSRSGTRTATAPTPRPPPSRPAC